MTLKALTPVPSPIRAYARQFLGEFAQALAEVPVEQVEAAVRALASAHAAEKAVYLMGNGGSAATASHFACDLHAAARGSKRLRVTSLNDNVPLLTALANDLGYENVFCEQLMGSLAADDVVILLSASGDSENIVRAARFGRQTGALTIGLFGFGGGRASTLVDHAIVVSSRDFGVVESVHNALEHLISSSFRREIAG